MITITVTNTIAIAIAIAIAISISPRLNAHTYAHNWWEAGTGFCWKIWVGDQLTSRLNCPPLLQNLRLRLSTPWPWGIMRSGRSVHAEDTDQTMISTDVMISATIRRQSPSTGDQPPATSLTPPGAWRVQLCKSLDRAHSSIHGSI